MVHDGKRFFAVGGYPTHHVIAVDPRGSGDVSESHIAWHKTNVRCYVPSPVVVGKYLIVADDRGTANCFDTETGERYWQNRMGRHFNASLLAVNDLVYFIDEVGNTKILRPGKEPEIVSENIIDDHVSASPALAHGDLFIRGEHHLYCISNH